MYQKAPLKFFIFKCAEKMVFPLFFYIQMGFSRRTCVQYNIIWSGPAGEIKNGKNVKQNIRNSPRIKHVSCSNISLLIKQIDMRKMYGTLCSF